ncbi:MAG: PEGA domain-containing protein [Myxococcales bacterium]|nr:PEGA domain-containing protein [Myxococcales bacterium]
MHSRLSNSSLTLATILLVTLGVAHADPSADKEAAQAAFARAEAAEARRDWRTAIDEYQRAYDLVPHPNALFNIAHDLELLEEYRNAAAFYLRYIDETSDEGERVRVKELVDALRKRSGILSITSVPPGAPVVVDGAEAGETPLNLELSGTHELVVGKAAASVHRTVTIEFGEPQSLHIPLPSEAIDDDAGETARAPADLSRRTANAPRRGPGRIAGLAATATGIVAMGTSLWLGATAKREYDRATDVCGSDLNCTDATDYEFAVARVDAARGRGNVATVVGGLGLAATITGVVLWFSSADERTGAHQEEHSTRFEPQIGPTRVGITATRSF